MSGETHTAVGIAAALTIMQPHDVKGIISCAGVAAIGAVICDIDAKNSTTHKEFNKSILITIFAICLMVGTDFYFDTSLIRATVFANITVTLATLAFVGVCIYGAGTPHRSFMHSIPAVLILSALTWIVLPAIALPFLIAMASHITIDLLNKKKVKLFYPIQKRWGVAIGICKADGLINRILELSATVYVISGITALLMGNWFW